MLGKAGRSTVFQSLDPAFAVSCYEKPQTRAVVNMLFQYLENPSFKTDSGNPMIVLIHLSYITASRRIRGHLRQKSLTETGVGWGEGKQNQGCNEHLTWMEHQAIPQYKYRDTNMAVLSITTFTFINFFPSKRRRQNW